MKKTIRTLALAALLAGVATQTHAENKVVVIPLFTSSDLALVHKTGQASCTDNDTGTWKWAVDCTNASPPGQDGELQPGMVWPNPRFIDNNNDGTVTDNMTGLVWLKNANCFGERTWPDALTDAAELNSGECGLMDGSIAGDWHVPTVNELQGIVHYGYYGPALSNAAGTDKWTTSGDAFSGVQSHYYWSSTTHPYYPRNVWSVYLSYGSVSDRTKSNTHYVWPVRGRQ